ncbi:T9SS type A sorting domain-containing protein [Flavicella marina]|uniref:T9SS type A sorting domain-containing protein n=1 Tax=Flavicella marina TaxID=1475951 RepID=UPI0012657FDD|nr:right-handed parallel beta-helix repeat-containing protein [Flavicella marina]
MKLLKQTLFYSLMTLHVIGYSRDIYVAKTGNDSNPGTEASPYLTITKAANVAVAGDVVYIKEGTYEETLTPANSGSAGNPIIFQSYPGDRVIVSAMQSLSGWTQDSGSIYKTTIPFNTLGQENFVMYNETACDLARWPNKTDDNPFNLETRRNTGGSGSDVIVDAYLESNEIPNIDWTGGTVFFYGDKPGSGWIAWKASIQSSSSGKVSFQLNKNPSWIRTFHAPADKGDFYLEGVKAALDNQNEWYYNDSSKELFLQIPTGVAPLDGEVKMRKRIKTIDLDRKSYIHIKNLAVFGGSITMDQSTSTNNLLYGVSSFYGNHTLGVFTGFNANKPSVRVNGSNNKIERCEIAFSAASGIYIDGQNNEVIDSRIHDFNYLGSYDAPLVARGGENNKFINNTIFNGGRDGINYNGKNCEFAYNDISRSNLIADDCALFYTVGAQYTTTIHHNWFHDVASSGSKKKAAGIYLDNDAEGFNVHHNVVWNTEWTGVQMNWDCKNINIYNNTFWNNEGGVMGAWHLEGTAFSDINVWNNLSNSDQWEPQSDKQNNIVTTSDSFQNIDRSNFNLVSTSEAIDTGKQIPGFTDGFIGENPDVGAYEFGGTKWVAGITWNYRLSPNGLGCYGLPGEDCLSFPKDDEDKDGVGDADDLCPNTPFGTPVNTDGCPVFSLDSENFKMLAIGETCNGNNDGKITIVASENLQYVAKISGVSIEKQFTTTTEFTNLPADTYTVCITIQGNNDFEQCFDLTVVKPSTLQVKSEVLKNSNVANLKLSGAELYRIEVNNTTYMTDESEIKIPLTSGENKISVTTNKDCQGQHIETIALSNAQLYLSNPVSDMLHISALNFTDNEVFYQIYATTGSIEKTGTTQLLDNNFYIDVTSLSSGIYIVNFSSKNHKIQSKFIKK